MDEEDKKEETGKEDAEEENEEPQETSGEEEREDEKPEKKKVKNSSEVPQSKEESKQARKVFFVVGFLVLVFLGIFIFSNSTREFTHEGIDFEIVKEGNLILYKTSLPVDTEHKITGEAIKSVNYNFFLRNDPRKLEKVPLKLDGELNLMSTVVMNFTESFNCEGMGVVGTANLVNLLGVLDVEVIRDETAICDPEGKYTFIRLQEGEETGIEQFGPSCYNFNINSCEVLEVTEKYMLELFSIVNAGL